MVETALIPNSPAVDSPSVNMARPARTIEFVSVVLPCLNEEDGVGPTVAQALLGLSRAGYPGEVIVVDNGSTDESVARAIAAGAAVVHEARRGYGAAHLAGVRAARGNVIVMADADTTYDLPNMHLLLAPLAAGADMVVGSRLQGTILNGAMPPLHRYVGTPVITRVLGFLTGCRLSDSQSGYRAFWRDSMLQLGLRATGMEYASEMLLRSGRAGLSVLEVPTDYRVRVGESKLSTFSDGWRHIQMLLLLSPHISLVLPGLLAVVFGALLCCVAIVYPDGIAVGSLRWPPIFIGPMLLILGVQAAFLGCIAAHRSALTPDWVRLRLSALERPGAVNRLLRGFLTSAVIGIAMEAGLFAVYLSGFSSDSLLGVAGLAVALIIIGFSGIASVFAVDYSRESLGW